jgi:hypothetical protein
MALSEDIEAKRKNRGTLEKCPTVYEFMLLYEYSYGEHTSLLELCHHQFLSDISILSRYIL